MSSRAADRMGVSANAALRTGAKFLSIGALCVLLSGCFITPDEPFSLANGDTPHLKTGTLSCTDPASDPGKTERKQFASLSYGDVSQYILIGDTDTSVQPFVFYQVKGDRYVVAQAAQGNGEALYIADVTDSSVTVFDDTLPDGQDAVMSAAKKYGLDVKVDGRSWNMSGPVEAQRKFVIDIAYGLTAPDVVYKCTRVAD